MNSLHVDAITADGGLRDIRTEWSDLWRRSTCVTPFQSPDWLIPWWNHFGGSSLLLLTARDGDRLAGVGPFQIYQPDHGQRTLCFLGTGISDYLDIISEPGMENSVVSAFLAFLADLPDWDIADLQDLRPDSPILGAPSPEGLRIRGSLLNTCTYLELPVQPHAFPSNLPKRLRRNVRHALRGLEKTGGFRLRIADEETLERNLDDLFRLHGARWGTKHQFGVLADNAVQAFHREAAPLLLQSKILNLCSLYLGERPISVYHSMIKGTVAYVYLGGLDPDCERFSPGAVGLYYTILNSIKAGARVADFLRGDEPYKQFWGVKKRTNCRIQITRK